MSYKKKLVILYVFIIVTPLLIFGLTTASMNKRVITTLNNEVIGDHETIGNQTSHRLIREYKKALEQSPNLVKNLDFLELLFNRYKDLTRLQVIDDDQIVYDNKRSIDSDKLILNETFVFSTEQSEIQVLIEYLEFIPPEKLFRDIFVERIMISLIIYLILHGIFIYWVIKSTLPDTKQLTDIANNISHGHYDFEFDTSRKDEIGDVYKAFDNMKISLQTYENNRKELITNISHDLKTPIATIKGYVTGINDGLASTPEKLNKYLNIIYNNTMHLDELINDLFLYSKLDVNQIDFDFKPIHFDKYIDYYIDELKLDLEEKNIGVKWQMPNLKNTIILGDGFRLKRILNNIVSNSQKHFNKTNNILSFKLSEDEKGLVLEITDNGKGISEEVLNQIFDRFYRADASRNTNMGSSGLGLAIVKQIVEKHNGSISAISKYNYYTKVSIHLPLLGENHE